MFQPNNFKECLSLLAMAGGFTYSLILENPKSGYMVSIEGLERKCDCNNSVVVFQDFVFENVTRATNENLYFGGWMEGQQIYFDLSKNIPNLKDAIRFGLENKQLAIFDVEKTTVISISDFTPQKGGTEKQKKSYINAWIDKKIKEIKKQS